MVGTRWAMMAGIWLWSAAAIAAPLPAFDGALLGGSWHDEGGTHLIIKGGKTPKVKKIIDGDGEKFKTEQQGWVDGGFEFTYFVPSTGYHVTILVTRVEGGVGYTEWLNDHDMSGTELMYKD
jgi:hypothetical protein